MRITKKFLRGAKSSLNKRLKQLTMMSFDDLLKECRRMWPEANITVDMANDSFKEYGSLLNQAMQWAIETSLPEHIL